MLFSFNQVFGSPNKIKTDLAKSGVYDALVTNLVQQTSRGNPEAPVAEPSTAGQTQLQQAIKESLPPSYIEKQINGVLDGVYAWVNGKTAEPEFKIDLTQFHTNLVNNIVAQSQKYAASLPVCNSQSQISPDFDPFGMTCLPAGTTPEQIAAQTRQQLLTSDLFKNTIITPADLTKDEPLSKKLAPAKTTRKVLNIAILASAGLVLLTAAGAVFLSRPWRKGIRRVAISCITVGASSAVLAVGSSYLLKYMSKNINQNGDQVLQSKLLDAARLLGDDLRNWWVGFGIVLVIIGVGSLIAMAATKPDEKKTPETPQPKTPEPSKPVPTAAEPAKSEPIEQINDKAKTK